MSKFAHVPNQDTCHNRSVWRCATPDNACVVKNMRCVFSRGHHEQLRRALNHRCEKPECLCTTEARPYTRTYRGRTYCDSLPMTPLEVVSGGYTAFYSSMPPANLIEFPFQLYQRISERIHLRGAWNTIVQGARDVALGTVAGVVTFVGTSIIRNACMALSLYYGARGAGRLRVSRIAIKLINVARARPDEASRAAQHAVGDAWSRAMRGAFRSMCREMTRAARNARSPGKKRAVGGLMLSVMGGQEETFFRGWLGRFVERIKKPIFRFLRRCGFRNDRTNEKYVERVYMAVNAVFSGVLFGLVHLTNMPNNPTDMARRAVLCQVVFTSVMGFVYTFLARYTTLATAWVAHFVHNFTAIMAADISAGGGTRKKSAEDKESAKRAAEH